MQIDVERYRSARRSLRIDAGFLIVVGTLGVAFTGLFVVFGLYELIFGGPVHPSANRAEGASVLAVAALPFGFSVFVCWSGIAKWRNSRDYDRLVDFMASRPVANVADAASALGVAPQRLWDLAEDGARTGFIFDAGRPELRLVGQGDGPGGRFKPIASKPGATSLLVALSSYGYGAVTAVLLLDEKGAGKLLGHDWVVLVCVIGIPLTFVLDTVSVVGAVLALRALNRLEPRPSTARPVAALILGLVGFVGVLLLTFGTALEMSFGPR